MLLRYILVISILLCIQPPQAKDEKPKAWHEKKRIAFLVGVNFYENTSTLKYAVSDAEKLEALFLQVGYYDKIIKLTDKGKVVSEKDTKTKAYSSKFPDKAYLPTKKNIEATYKELVAEKPDMLLMYFSGHGFISDGKEDKENSIASRDTDLIQEGDKFKPKNGISILELANHTNSEEFRKVNLVFLIDACRSDLPDPEAEKVSSNSKNEKNVIKAKPILIEKNTKETNQELVKKEISSEFAESVSKDVEDSEGVVMLIGAAPGDSSFEDKKLESGIFSYFLREGIAGGIQNENAIEYVTVGMVKEYIDAKFEEYAKSNPKKHKQKNYLLTNSRGFRGDFLLTYGRPSIMEEKLQKAMEANTEQFYYYDTLENRNVFSKLRYSKNWNRKELRFFVKEGKTNKYYPESLEGVYRMKYDITRDPNTFSTINYSSTQYNLDNVELFTYRLGKLIDSGTGKESGFEYNGVYQLTEFDRNDSERKNIQYERKIFDKEGRVLLEEYFDAKGAKINIRGVSTIKRSFGKVIREEYLNSSGKPTLRNKYASHEIDYNDLGNIETEAWFDTEKKLVQNENGIAKLEYLYNSEKYNTAIRNLDASSQVTNDKIGISQILYSYNPECLKNKKEKTIEFAEDKKLAETKWLTNGYRACIEKIEYVDKDKNPVSNSDGFSKFLFKFDEKGNRILEERYLKDQKKWIQNGIAYLTFAHDADGNITEKKHFGELTNDGKHHPISDENRVHQYKYSYSEQCLKIRRQKGAEIKDFDCVSEITHFDLGGNKIIDKKGIHKIKIWYDGKNQKEKFSEYYGLNDIYLNENKVKDIEVYNPEGKLDFSLSEYNGALTKRICSSCDKKKRIILSYLIKDKKEELINKSISEFNDQGLLALITFYKIEDGKEILEEKDFYEYDARGNMIKRITKKNLSKKTNPIKSIYQSIKSAFIDIEQEGIVNLDTEEIDEYDENNNILKGVIYYIKLGIRRESFRAEFKYDSYGNIIYVTSFIKGEKEGEVFKEYDKNGNLISDKPIEFKNGKEVYKTIYHFEYDKAGRRTSLSNKAFENGKETRSSNIKFNLEYDEIGNAISETTLREADKSNNSFLRKKIYQYDKSKNPIFQAEYSNKDNKIRLDSKTVFDSQFFEHEAKYKENLVAILRSLSKSPIAGTREVTNLENRLREKIGNMPETAQKKEIQKKFDDAKNFFETKKKKYTLVQEEYTSSKDRFSKQEYKLLFFNNDAAPDKQLIQINLDRFYRPVGIVFEGK